MEAGEPRHNHYGGGVQKVLKGTIPFCHGEEGENSPSHISLPFWSFATRWRDKTAQLLCAAAGWILLRRCSWLATGRASPAGAGLVLPFISSVSVSGISPLC